MEAWLKKRYIRQAAKELWEGGDAANTVDVLVTEEHMSPEEADAFILENMTAIRREERLLNEWLDGVGEIVGV